MKTNLKSKYAFDQLANKLETSITPDDESLDQKSTPEYNYMAVYKLVLNFYDPANYT